jgi:hypothetical protein
MPFLPNTGLASEELFSEGSLETLLQRQSADALEEVDTIDADQLLATPADDLVDALTSSRAIDVPKLREDQIYQEPPKEVWRDVEDYGRMVRVRGFLYTIAVPFEGHLGLFRFSPLTYPASSAQARAFDDKLVFEFAGYDLTADDIRQELNKRIYSIKQHLALQEAMVTPFNARLLSGTRAAIENRKKSILGARNISASLGYRFVAAAVRPFLPHAWNVLGMDQGAVPKVGAATGSDQASVRKSTRPS